MTRAGILPGSGKNIGGWKPLPRRQPVIFMVSSHDLLSYKLKCYAAERETNQQVHNYQQRHCFLKAERERWVKSSHSHRRKDVTWQRSRKLRSDNRESEGQRSWAGRGGNRWANRSGKWAWRGGKLKRIANDTWQKERGMKWRELREN